MKFFTSVMNHNITLLNLLKIMQRDPSNFLKMETQNIISLSILWRDKRLELELEEISSMKELGHKLQILTGVKADTMRLIFPQSTTKGSKLIIPFSDEHSSLRLQEISVHKVLQLFIGEIMLFFMLEFHLHSQCFDEKTCIIFIFVSRALQNYCRPFGLKNWYYDC